MDDHVEKRGTSSSQIPKQERHYYDANYKLNVIRYAEDTNNCAAGRKFGISEKNVRRWRKQKIDLQSASSTRKSFGGPKKGRFDAVDERVVAFVCEKRAEGMPISREILKLKGLEIATALDIPRTEFKASTGWCVRMMRRAGFSLRRRTSLAQRLPSDFSEKLIKFQQYVIRLRKQYSYLLGQMGNADQTPVYFDMPSSVTVNKKGAKSVIVKTTGNEKSRMTVMLCVLADGRKLPPYVVLRRKTMPKENLPRGVIFRCQEKGWMDQALVLDWLKVVWNNRPGALLRKRGMLVLDAFRGHLTEPVKAQLENFNTDLVIIPGGMTSQLQVLDVVVNKPFKDQLRKHYNDWLLSGNHQLTPTGKIRKPSVALLGQWILASWNDMKSESIVKGFKKCCISNAMDGSEDNVLWQNSEDEDDNEEAEDSEESDNESDSDSHEVDDD